MSKKTQSLSIVWKSRNSWLPREPRGADPTLIHSRAGLMARLWKRRSGRSRLSQRFLLGLKENLIIGKLIHPSKACQSGEAWPSRRAPTRPPPAGSPWNSSGLPLRPAPRTGGMAPPCAHVDEAELNGSAEADEGDGETEEEDQSCGRGRRGSIFGMAGRTRLSSREGLFGEKTGACEQLVVTPAGETW